MNNPNQKLLGPLTMKALEKQRLFWIKRVESSCDDEDDRLLPDASPYTTKLVEYSHLRTLHGGVGMTMAHVRENYWISRQATSTSAASDQEMLRLSKISSQSFTATTPRNASTRENSGKSPIPTNRSGLCRTTKVQEKQ
jgi:hypothetical protein